MTSLFIGRFQPLHLGHLSVLKKFSGTILVGIGSSQYARTTNNPLSFAERKQCLEIVLPGIPVIAIPDIHDDAHWVDHVKKTVYAAYPSGFDQVISGNRLVQLLFRKQGIPVLDPAVSVSIDGTVIRRLIKQHNDIWKHYVPSSIQPIIEPVIAGTGIAA
ncbi:MAG: hypothetical protein WCV88_04740 [Patescibacteria group bacterium]|jgi:nicotinamide-nucleotide adenylyltransferase